MHLRAVVALALLFALPARADTIQRATPLAVRSLAIAPRWSDFVIDFDGDTQDQAGPQTCNNANATTIAGCTAHDYNTASAGGGWVPSVVDCSTQIECLDPNTGVNRCARSPYCLGANWIDHGIAVLDRQNRVHRGLDKRSPQRAALVVQVGDQINQGLICGSWARSDSCTSATDITDACTGLPGTTTAEAKAEIWTENTRILEHYLQPLIDDRVPVASTWGNHDVLGCWESRLRVALSTQPGYGNATVDGTKNDTSTMYTLTAQTPVGKVCVANYGFNFYGSTVQAMIGVVDACGGLPTIVNSHNGFPSVFQSGSPSVAWWASKGSFTTTQVVDRTGHPEVLLNAHGHTLPNEMSFTRFTGANTNSGADIVDLKVDFQWSSFRGVGNATFGGGAYDGVTSLDGSGGVVVRCTVSPTLQTMVCLPYNPVAGVYGAWDYASTGYGGIAGASMPLDWCTRFGTC